MEATIMLDDKVVFDDESDNLVNEFKPFIEPISNTTLKDNDFNLIVRIHFDVDFGRRNSDSTYQDQLRNTGVVIRNIRVVGKGTDDSYLSRRHLTFGDYVNEDGISEDERIERLKTFWKVCRYHRDIAYQTIVESSLKNMIGSGIACPNNYSTGDLYGDAFVAKSVLDPRYDMNLSECSDDMLCGVGREYLGMGSCSDQLSLVYKPLMMKVSCDENGNVATERVNPEPALKYQMVEVVKNINRFESSIKHKSNVFSVVVENSNLAKSSKDEKDMTEEERTLEKYKEQLRDSVTQFVRNICEGTTPVHTQLFDVQFT